MKGNNNIIRQTHNTNVKEATNIIKMSSTIMTFDRIQIVLILFLSL